MTTLESFDRDKALHKLNQLVAKSKRTKQVPFAKEFLQSPSGHPPLSQLIQGGRGGEVRLKLYLTVTMVATRAPYSYDSPNPIQWAETLGVTGKTPSRRVSTAMRWLAQHNFVRLDRRPGKFPTITLLDPALSKEPYKRPIDKGSHYVTLPLGIWKQGWILDLSATELALLLVLFDVQQGKDQARYVAGSDRAAYGFSTDTWTKATKTLRERGLLEIWRVPQGGEFDYRRMRNMYRINRQRLDSPPMVHTNS